MQTLEGVGENVFVAEHDTLWRAFAARREQYGGRVIGTAQNLRLVASAPAGELVTNANCRFDVFEIDNFVFGFELGQHLSQSRLFDKGARGDNGFNVSCFAGRKHICGTCRIVEHGRHAANRLQGKESDRDASRVGQ